MISYLNMVLVYLQNELPEYKTVLTIHDGQFILKVEDDIPFHNSLKTAMEKVNKVLSDGKIIEYDLIFTVWNSNNQKQFEIKKS
ncbi:hypothetical protein GCM10023149_21510 [Mucilaginibacter gynuensis]|uniref:Uncharacterized protein n=1 Tax=Mucilaginibacter gynuensis TaxID=1302236 RepID=A0ABP8GC82_9SPHI